MAVFTYSIGVMVSTQCAVVFWFTRSVVTFQCHSFHFCWSLGIVAVPSSHWDIGCWRSSVPDTYFELMNGERMVMADADLPTTDDASAFVCIEVSRDGNRWWNGAQSCAQCGRMQGAYVTGNPTPSTNQTLNTSAKLSGSWRTYCKTRHDQSSTFEERRTPQCVHSIA